jgi:hypothetical protein
LKLAQERGEVVAVSDVQRSIETVASSLKTAILAWPSKLITRLYGVKDRNQMRAILEKESRELCNQLASVGQSSAPQKMRKRLRIDR